MNLIIKFDYKNFAAMTLIVNKKLTAKELKKAIAEMMTKKTKQA